MRSRSGTCRVVATASSLVPATDGAEGQSRRTRWAPRGSRVHDRASVSAVLGVRPQGVAPATGRNAFAPLFFLALAALGGCVAEEPRTPLGHGYRIFTTTFAQGMQGIGTGDYFRPAVSYEPIRVESKFTHVLAFDLKPMAPPSRRGIPSNGPIILFSDDMDIIVFSPLDHFFVSLISFEQGELRYGIEGEVTEIPLGFSHSFIQVRGKGLNSTLERWGDLLRERHGRARPDRYADTGLSYLGYWTDNGSTYYYRTEPGMNEEETLLAVKKEADARGIPYGYFQIDSWWYFKETPHGGGLILWEPQPWMFPDGLAAFRKKLGLPLVAHNRWFSVDNAYRDRHAFVEGGGKPDMALPLDRGVFDELMRNARSWGIETYEQDWLMSQYWGLPHLRNAVDHAESWMQAMNDAALDQGLTMQLCMPGAAHLMDSVDRPAVTTTRVAIDYIPGVPKEMYWPEFHQVSLLAWAVGLWPFKDNFQTTPGQRALLSERNGVPEALMSALSAGMVGPSDRIGAADAVLLNRTCRRDGLLLKPDKPATPIDAMFLDHDRPYLTSTYSRRVGLGEWTYLAAYAVSCGTGFRRTLVNLFAAALYQGRIEDLFACPEEIRDWKVDLSRDLDTHDPRVVYDWRAGTATVADAGFEIPPIEKPYDYAYFVLAPVLSNGLALIGETEKFVTLADKRFEGIDMADDAITVRLAGVPGEAVSLLAYDARAGRLLPRTTARIPSDGKATVILSR